MTSPLQAVLPRCLRQAAELTEVRDIKQRAVTILATYLSKRPLGRLIRVRCVGSDDYIVAIEDVRDARTQLLHSPGDLRKWLESFKKASA